MSNGMNRWFSLVCWIGWVCGLLAVCPGLAEVVEATGGDWTASTLAEGRTYRFHVFTTVGEASLAVETGGPAQCLIVGGGGGGGDRVGAGGGAGGLILTNLLLTSGSNYLVTVGGGGVGLIGQGAGGDGAPSQFALWTAQGGGGGGGYHTAGRFGGSGGGAPGYAGYAVGLGQPGQGHGGGGGGNYGAGGGGGAGAAGGAWKGSNIGGDGGEGRDVSAWLGLLTAGDAGWFAGGGGGGGYQEVTASVGGRGGGGAGGLRNASPASGMPGTGGGGGGRERFGDAGHGGSGIVIIRYEMPADVPYYETSLPLVLADLGTGSERFTRSNEVAIASLPVPLGYTHYKISESGDASAALEGTWMPTNTLNTATFAQPGGDTNATLYAWFTNTAAEVWLLRATGSIVWTTARPVPAVFETLRRVLPAGGTEPVVLVPGDLDTGSTGGVYGETVLAIIGWGLACEADQTPEAPEVTLYALGAYDVVLTLVNEAGNTAMATSTVSVLAPGTYTYYVDAANTGHAAAPYASWATAATNIQEAIMQAEADVDPAVGLFGEVVVTDGVYVVSAPLTVTRPILLRSWSGDPGATRIAGAFPASSNRCLVVAGPAVVAGLTFTNGYAGEGSELGNRGAGIYMTHGIVRDCRIVGNQGIKTDVNALGVGVYMEGGMLSNCLIQANTTTGAHGAGIYARNPASVIVDCRILDNGRADISNTHGGGLYLALGARAVRSTIARNAARTGGGGVYCNGENGRTLLADCVISNNVAYSGAGVMVYYYGDLERCVIVHNESLQDGGGLYLNSRGSAVRNCLFVGNQASRDGGGAMNIGGQSGGIGLDNCTIVRNRSGRMGGGLHVNAIRNAMTLANSIIVDNLAGSESNDVYLASSAPVVTHACTPPPALAGTGNRADDPRFTDPGSGYGLAAAPGDYTLRRSSPCRDSGMNDEAWMTTATDLAGNPRILPVRNGTVDLGAYENPPFPHETVILVR